MDDVVIDEWILIRSFALEHDPAAGEDGEPDDFRPVEILTLAQDSCRWAVSDETVAIYLNRIFSAPYKGILWNRLRASIFGVLADSERRVHFIDPPIVEAGQYHHKDEVWVSVAAAAGGGCRLITGDNNLVTDLTTNGTAERVEIVPMGIDAAHNWVMNELAGQANG